MKKCMCLILILASVAGAKLRSDINCDGRVDIGDFAIMAEEWLMSETDYCLQFSDAQAGTFTVPFFSQLDFGNYSASVSFWVKIGYGGSVVVERRHLNGTWHWNISLSDNAATGPGTQVSYQKEAASQTYFGFPQDEQWHLVCLIFNRPAYEVQVYIDTVQVASMPLPGHVRLFSSTGGNLIVTGRTACFDNLQVYRTHILTPAEMEADYNAGMGRKIELASNMVWGANFDEGVGSSVTALTGPTGALGNPASVGWCPGGVPITPETKSPCWWGRGWQGQ